jgi:hypothetical protein
MRGRDKIVADDTDDAAGLELTETHSVFRHLRVLKSAEQVA